ncbi:MAG TPA: aminopeptidase P N-terminal domain-containing protein [Kofleriaceae bacterium]|jgi:Xaa-Pro aminopeptidase|nr:aminopeptidase P N-terminal domain-containing protein [Kofleriaceae bacterium]
MSDLAGFARRRAAYMEALGGNAVAVISSPPERLRNGDAHFPFRQSSDLYYLTGFVEPEATLVLRPGADKDRVVLFVRPRDRDQEIWNGRRAGVDGAVSRYGADVAYPAAELADKLPGLIANFDDLYFSLGLDPEMDALVCRVIAEQRMRERRGQRAPRRVVDPREVLHEMRLRKSPDEIAVMRRAAAITAEAHRAAMKLAGDGVGEHELAAIIDYTFRRHGGSGPGYQTIVGSGENATILHYIENNRPMRAGDLCLIDAGGEYQMYTADVTRTFPVDGRFTAVQRRCYELVLAAQKAAIEMCRPGATIDGIHDRVVQTLTEGMVQLGLLDGPAQARIDDGTYKKFYMHRTSHWLGMDVHDVGNYGAGAAPSRPLEAGMVITIEPGLYVPMDVDGVPEELRGIGIRIEDDILITANGYENLTSAAPKEVDEVEAACRA